MSSVNSKLFEWQRVTVELQAAEADLKQVQGSHEPGAGAMLAQAFLKVQRLRSEAHAVLDEIARLRADATGE